MKTKLLIFSFSIFLALGSSRSMANNVNFDSYSSSYFQQNNDSKDFTISPNPSSTKLNLRLASLNERTTLTVFDILGKKIYSKEIDQLTTTLDVSRWNNGVYLVRVTTDKATQTKRFVKQ